MAKERLSKLQKWILVKDLQDIEIGYRTVASYFGKKNLSVKPRSGGWYSDMSKDESLIKSLGPDYKEIYDIEEISKKYLIGNNWIDWEGYEATVKKELFLTGSEKAIISRSLRGLLNKGLLTQKGKYGRYRLTEAGFLKANNCNFVTCFVSFKDYQKEIDRIDFEHEESTRKLREVFSGFRRIHRRRRKAS